MHKIDYIKIASLILLPISLIKKFNGVVTYFQIFYILLGIYSFFQYKLWKNKVIQTVIGIFAINIIASFLINQSANWLEYIQLGAMICLIWLIKNTYTELDFVKYSKITISIASLICIYNFMQSDNIFAFRSFFGIPRVGGIIGEPNFSAFATFLPCLIFYEKKMFKWLLIGSFPLLTVQSRSVYIAIFILIMLEMSSYLIKTKKLRFKEILLYIFLFSPFLIAITYETSSSTTKKSLVNKLSTRFYLTRYYTEQGIKHPFGVGLANGQPLYKKEGVQFREKVANEINSSNIEHAEQHSIFNQVLSEFGIIIYFFIFIGLVRYRNQIFQYINNSHISAISILVFINGINELTTFLLIAYILKNKPSELK